MTHDGTLDERPAVAAIGHDGRTDIDDLLVVFADQQRRAGRKVLGLVMKPRERGDGCKAAMVLTDIDTGYEYLVAGAGFRVGYLQRGSARLCASEPSPSRRACLPVFIGQAS